MSEPTSLCEVCCLLSIELLRDNDFSFQPDLSSLRRSTHAGCPFCLLCWTRLEQTWTKAALSKQLGGMFDSEEAQKRDRLIWLRGEFHDLGSWEIESQGSQIIVSCGRLRGFPDDTDAQSSGGLYAYLCVFAEPGTAEGCF